MLPQHPLIVRSSLPNVCVVITEDLLHALCSLAFTLLFFVIVIVIVDGSGIFVVVVVVCKTN